jgi:type VI secretion system protein ImpC
MSTEQINAQSRGATVLSEENQGVYGALFGKINLNPVKCWANLKSFKTMRHFPTFPPMSV